MSPIYCTAGVNFCTSNEIFQGRMTYPSRKNDLSVKEKLSGKEYCILVPNDPDWLSTPAEVTASPCLPISLLFINLGNVAIQKTPVTTKPNETKNSGRWV